ncbi:head GIN domain-containing protein [Roseateles sp. BYS180W]|uniref:Head GIN domain-containing protein n=1 Tax=Roseateles rivi TaxID=3299028 RepID=A0ABW7FWL4_9BURK
MNIQRRTVLGAALLLSIGGAAQAFSSFTGAKLVEGDGRPSSQTRSVDGAVAVDLRGSFDLTVQQGSRDHLELRADANVLPYIDTRLTRSSSGVLTLIIETKPSYRLQYKQRPQITLELRQIQALALSGSGSITLGQLQAQGLDLSVAGSGRLRLNKLKLQKLDLSVAGSGDVHAQGVAQSVSVSVAGSGDADLRALLAQAADISIAGSGRVYINAQQDLSVSIAGSGDVNYVGQPRLDVSQSGSGRVRPLK